MANFTHVAIALIAPVISRQGENVEMPLIAKVRNGARYYLKIVLYKTTLDDRYAFFDPMASPSGHWRSYEVNRVFPL